METKAKWDLNAPSIVGIVFCFMGIVYTAISIILFIAPADPDSLAVRSVFLPLGLVLFLVGFFLLFRCVVKKHQADQLIADGRYIWATVTELHEIQHINSFRGHPCVIMACFTDARGQTYCFRSRCLYKKPDAAIVGKPIKVYIDGGNYTIYYMDAEPLLPRKRIH